MAFDFSDLGPIKEGSSQFDFSDLGPSSSKSVSGFAKNAVQDVKDTAKGLGHLGEGLLLHPIDTTINVATNLPKGIVEEGKRLGVGELLTGHPINAIEKFGDAAYNKPLTTLMDVLPAAGAAGKALGIGGKAAEMGGLVDDVARSGASVADDVVNASKGATGALDDVARTVTEAPKPINLPDEAAQILKTAPEAPPTPPTGAPAAAQAAAESVPMGATFHDTVQNLATKIPGAIKKPMEQVGEYLSGKYGQAASKPKWSNVVADYMKEHGQNMTLKELGAAPGQVRKIGVERAHDLADYALEHNLAGPKVGTIGREKMLPKMLDDAGGAVGAFRKMASDRGAIHSADKLIEQVRSQLDEKYLRAGMYSGQKGTYMKGLMELKKATPTAEGMAEKITEMFQESKKLDPLRRPSGPLADIAHQVREINNELIAKTLSKEEMTVYERALEDYGALKQIHEFAKRRASTEAGGRLGPGSGISRAAVQKFLDSVGYRTQAKVMRSLSEKIRTNPEIAQTPKNLFRNYIDEAAEAIDEMTTEAGQ